VRPSRLILAGAVLIVAGVLVALAADVVRWGDAMKHDAHAKTVVPFGSARRLLALDDDLALRRAVRLYRGVRGQARSYDPSRVRRARIGAEIALADVAASQSGAQASQADDLLGILAFADATASSNDTSPFGSLFGDATAGSPPSVQGSVGAFQSAVQLDGRNEAAKYNLELVLRLLKANGERAGGTPSAGPRGGGKRGAGGGTPGRGY
jgi:hypothetical protein